MGSDNTLRMVHKRAEVSIRAPAWGATRAGRRHRHRWRRFNSRSRMGSDLVEVLLVLALAVSIRAPAWGATGLS